MTATVYTVTTDEDREAALAAVQDVLLGGRTAVIPTDTVYGIAADAFSRGGVAQLLAAKGRSRRMPPPVLIADPSVLPGLAENPGEDAQALAERFWPGALTLIVHAQPSLNWDLGETHGTVALRVPDDELARDLLRRTGPLAVSSANRTGQQAATDAEEAVAQLGERVEAVLDGGRRPRGRAEDLASAEVQPSTIIDVTGPVPVVVRQGALSLPLLREVAPGLLTREEYERDQRGEQASAGGSTAAGAAAGTTAEASRAHGDPGIEDTEDVTGTSDAEEQAEASVHGPGEGPRARPARAGGVEEALVGSSPAGDAATNRVPPEGGVDQMRSRPSAESGPDSRSVHRPSARPVGVEEARRLFFSQEDSAPED